MADHFSFTKLIVHDLERAAVFYKEVCGVTELGRVESKIEGRRIKEIMFNATGQGGATFVLLAYPDDPAGPPAEVILGFITKDLNAFVDRVRKAGGKVTQEMAAQPEHGVKVAFVRDPEGHLIEVVELL